MYPTLDVLARQLPNNPETRRFLNKIEAGPVPAHAPNLGPCLLWTAAKTSKGYAAFRGGLMAPGGPRLVGGHHWLYYQLHGQVPEGYELDHICHVPELCTVPVKQCPHRPCVLHTVPKLVAENRLRSNSQAALNAVKVFCAGEFGPHDLGDPKNLYIAPKTGERKCRPCQNERSRLWKIESKRLLARARDRGLREAGHLTLIG